MNRIKELFASKVFVGCTFIVIFVVMLSAIVDLHKQKKNLVSSLREKNIAMGISGKQAASTACTIGYIAALEEVWENACEFNDRDRDCKYLPKSHARSINDAHDALSGWCPDPEYTVLEQAYLSRTID